MQLHQVADAELGRIKGFVPVKRATVDKGTLLFHISYSYSLFLERTLFANHALISSISPCCFDLFQKQIPLACRFYSHRSAQDIGCNAVRIYRFRHGRRVQ